LRGEIGPQRVHPLELQIGQPDFGGTPAARIDQGRQSPAVADGEMRPGPAARLVHVDQRGGDGAARGL
jgi:hypothetical protein